MLVRVVADQMTKSAACVSVSGLGQHWAAWPHQIATVNAVKSLNSETLLGGSNRCIGGRNQIELMKLSSLRP